MEPAFRDRYLALAADLRAAGINTELYTQDRKLGDQLKYADRKGIPVAVIAGESEFDAGTVVLKALESGEQTTHPRGRSCRRRCSLCSAEGVRSATVLRIRLTPRMDGRRP